MWNFPEPPTLREASYTLTPLPERGYCVYRSLTLAEHPALCPPPSQFWGTFGIQSPPELGVSACGKQEKGARAPQTPIRTLVYTQ